MDYQKQYEVYRQAVEETLRQLPLFAGAMVSGVPMTEAPLEPPQEELPPQPLRDAMAYSLWQRGKRLRPVLLLASYAVLRPDWQRALPYAAALEMLHTYSLIHDDLPALDNDVLRRGQPTSHKVFGEGMAILAGDALQSAAFDTMLDAAVCDTMPVEALAAMSAIARRAGVTGMIAGQTLDVKLEGEKPTEALVSYIHQHKTADLITAAIEAGLLLAGADETQVEAGTRYGQQLGVAFQIVDDLLDVEGDAATVGKAVGKDALLGKLTWPSLFTAEKCRADAAKAVADALESLRVFSDASEFLADLAQETLVRAK